MPLRQNTEGDTSGVGFLERMKRGSGIKGRDDKSSSIEILMAPEDFATRIKKRRKTKKEKKKLNGQVEGECMQKVGSTIWANYQTSCRMTV
jgi:hypothetical protein